MDAPISDLKTRLAQALEVRNMRAVDLSRISGISRPSISQYLSGRSDPTADRLLAMSKALRVSLPWLLGYDVPMEDSTPLPAGLIPLPGTKVVPLLGDIACGTPILAEENILDYITMPDKYSGNFALRCKGDSMINARIFDGDIVYIRQQPEVENGEIAAVMIDGEATLKRFYKYMDKIVLRAENPIYRDLVYTEEEYHNISIIGKALAFLSAIE